MARIQYGDVSGETITYAAYQPDGTVRTAAGTSIPEIAGTGYYTVVDANVQAGDALVFSDTAGNKRGFQSFTDPTDSKFIKDVMEGDITIDQAPTPWQMVIKIKGTSTELIRKDLKTTAAADITADNSIIGQYVEP